MRVFPGWQHRACQPRVSRGAASPARPGPARPWARGALALPGRGLAGLAAHHPGARPELRGGQSPGLRARESSDGAVSVENRGR